jgi:hypothetical protein
MNEKTAYMLLAAGVLAAYLVTKPKTSQAGQVGGVREIFPTGDTNGWRYFANGTAISPDGVYYVGGQMVWNPMM